MSIQFNSTPDTNIRAGIYEVTEDQNKTSQNDGGEEVVRNISFAEILQQVKDRDAQERQFGMDEDEEGVKSEDNYIGKLLIRIPNRTGSIVNWFRRNLTVQLIGLCKI